MNEGLPPRPGEGTEVTRQAMLLRRLLRAMTLLVLLGAISGFVDPRNDVWVTTFFYSVVFSWLAVVLRVVRSGRVVLATWVFALFFWGLIAFVTLSFGGLKGQHASLFAVCTLVIGSVVGGRAAIWIALLSSAWCGLVAYLEVYELLPLTLGPYTPLNAWASVTITILLTTVLLHESLTSLKVMHKEAQNAATERDEALRRSIQGQKMELVGNLTSGVAHDLNNLLTVIVGAVEVLRFQTPPEDRDTLSLLDDLQSATSRSALMTAQLLAFGRRRASEPEQVDFSSVLDAMGPMLRRLLGSALHLEVRSEPDCWVYASRSGLEQILLNLAVNARDAMAPGGKFELSVFIDGDRVILEARDTGSGMSPEVRRRIFEPFFTTKATGTGLGLTTIRQLTEHYRGTIDVESQPDRGTTFQIGLPKLVRPTKPPQNGARDVVSPSSSSQGVTREGRILLVEDDALVRRTLTRLLTLDGYDVTAVADGEEAISIVATARDLKCVVTDLSMPRMDGEALASNLNATHPGLPMVIISGNREPSAGRPLGMPRIFLPKPVSHDDLRNAIATLTAVEPSRLATAVNETRGSANATGA